MTRFLVFHNPNVSVPRNLFLVLGASEKFEDETKAGRFGSGAKMSAIALTRRGIPPVILGNDSQGPYRIEYKIRPGASLGISQDVVEATVNGASFGIMGTLSAGRNWDKPIPGDANWAFRSIRELLQNHLLDSANGIHAIQESFPDPADGATTVLELDSEGAVEEIANNLEKYLATRVPDETTTISKSERVRIFLKSPDKARLYISGLLASVLKKDSRFDIDLWLEKSSTVMDEERQISDFWAFLWKSLQGIVETRNPLIAMAVLLDMEDQGSLAQEIFRVTSNISTSSESLAIWKQEFRKLYSASPFYKETLLSGPDGAADRRASELVYRVVGTHWPSSIKNLLKEAGIRSTENLIPKKDRISWIPIPPKDRETLDIALEVVGSHIPDIARYSVQVFSPEEDQTGIQGVAVDGVIGLSCELFKIHSESDRLQSLVATLVHERDHLATGAGDGSLRFRDEADNNLARLMILGHKKLVSCEVVPYRGGFRIRVPNTLRLPAVSRAEWYSSGDTLMVYIEGYGTLVTQAVLPEGRSSGILSYTSKGERFLGIPTKFQGDHWKEIRILRLQKLA